jgi:hypothetical protein
MAVSPPSLLPVPLPTEIEAAALQIVSAYLHRAGTTLASRLLGCPDLNPEATLAADLSDRLLGSAALCQGVLDLVDKPRQG